MMLAPCSRAARATAKPMPEVPPMRRTRVLVSLLMEMKFIVFELDMVMIVGLYDTRVLFHLVSWLVGVQDSRGLILYIVSIDDRRVVVHVWYRTIHGSGYVR